MSDLHSRRTNAEFLDASFDYHDRWLSHFPLRGDQPAVPRNPFHERHPTASERLGWWGHLQEMSYNIAIVTGQISRVMAFRIDSPRTWTLLYDELQLPQTPMLVRSENGQGDAYYKLPEGLILGNRVTIQGVELTIRGEGDYCIAPPSTNPKTGGRYERVGSWNMEVMPTFDPKWSDGAAAPMAVRRHSVASIESDC